MNRSNSSIRRNGFRTILAAGLFGCGTFAQAAVLPITSATVTYQTYANTNNNYSAFGGGSAGFPTGTVYNIRFNSSFRAINPALRDQRAGYARNNVVHAQHWVHGDGPRPTLCLIHGFMGSAYLFNGLFFSLPWFYRSGYDVLLYTLPFHGMRAESNSPYSGYGYFADGMPGFAEAMAQAVHDFRSVIDYLEYTGVDRIALTGMSLGGYTSALIASVDDRIQAVIPNVPASSRPDW